MVLIVIVALFLLKLAHFYPGRDCCMLWSWALHLLKLVCCTSVFVEVDIQVQTHHPVPWLRFL